MVIGREVSSGLSAAAKYSGMLDRMMASCCAGAVDVRMDHVVGET